MKLAGEKLKRDLITSKWTIKENSTQSNTIMPNQDEQPGKLRGTVKKLNEKK